MTSPRLLFLSFAFPPGVSGLLPELQPAGHLIETSMIESIRPWFEVRSAGVSGLEIERLALSGRSSPGLAHALNLLDKAPEIIHRYRSLRRLKRAYLNWLEAGWRPSVILVCNLSPIYNAFIRWLKHQAPPSPVCVLYLADSNTLGLNVPWLKRLRCRFKPLVYPEADMLPYFQACVATSQMTEIFFAPRHVPWLWLPNGVEPRRALPPKANPAVGPIRFGYFGALAAHAGLPALLKVFLARERASTLEICGYGKSKTVISEMCRAHPGLRFWEPRTPDECLQFAQECDVLINPRPIHPGNENNFSSKVFEYALSARAILTTRLSGVEAVLGPEAYYFDELNFESSLDEKLEELARQPRAELDRRGAAIQERLLQHWSWEKQGEKLARFLEKLLTSC